MIPGITTLDYFESKNQKNDLLVSVISFPFLRRNHSIFL
ncbi:hypothetical protein NARC_160031 [Candidatus Nitrosocosmicus arcticus]|uniref:Uncharacterized protein n=1 Tax=Candidatus Nitrosocosmicus arcticus TaxID=2035267 RepID=A0A557SRU2_9ARCH|nr:hypothetical protein NARC_160031 [Candidatus Nitrosocosmicus arcticus]